MSTGVYLTFIALAMPLMYYLSDAPKENDLIMLAGKVSILLPLPLVIAAVLSPLSAAWPTPLVPQATPSTQHKGALM